MIAEAPAGFRVCVTSTELSALSMIRRRISALRVQAEVQVASPAEVAARTTPDQPFDLTIVDEAARMPVAVGLALAARTRQLVAVGDPLQLGPKGGGESLLARAVSSGMAQALLPWHYRSSTASLISPMNMLVYAQQLRAVPTPNIAGISGLRLHELHPEVARVDGRWVVVSEADAVVAALEEHARSGDTRSLAVLTLRVAQTDYLRGRIAAAVADGRFSWADLNRSSQEPFLLATATDAQGEERDRVLISAGFARRGATPLGRFGCLEASDPLRVLNVAMTRARDSCDLHVSIGVGDIERSPMSPAAAAFAFVLKAVRLFTRVDSLLVVDDGLSVYARRRGLEVRHLGVIQGLFRPGDARFSAGVVKHELPHDTARWGAIARQLSAKGWPVVEATEACLERLHGSAPCVLGERLDALVGVAGR